MKTSLLAAAVSLLMIGNFVAAQSGTTITIETQTGALEGTLLVPEGTNRVPVVLLIAGSGPTDRDGNNPAMKNNSLKMLATELSKHGVASLRYDKRGIGKSKAAGTKEADLRFDQYISDARDWISLLKKDQRFSRIVVIGHSEGSLVGMVASREEAVDGFISIAGSGLSADKILVEQLKSQPPQVLEMSRPIIDKLASGQTVEDVNPMLYSLFRPSVQPYMISWFKYDPAKEIAKLDIPVLIIQGSTDIQVGKEHADLLAGANQKSEKIVIEGMNHIFKQAEPDRRKNIQTYTQPDLPIMPELVKAIIGFIGKEPDVRKQADQDDNK